MAQYKTEAILLVVRDFGDADRMVTLFSRDYGKLTAVAYGARRPRSPLAGCVQPFVQAELALADGKNLATLRQCETKRSFREIRENLTAMAYANFIAELTTQLWPERVAEPAIFDLLIAVFGLLVQRNPRIAALAFALQIMGLAGYRPERERCVVCGQPLAFPARFDVEAGGTVCLSCANPNCIEYTEEADAFMTWLSALDWQNPGQFSIAGAVLMDVEKLLLGFVTWHLERPLKSLAFIAAVT